jgi:effector-binding domain-containing protein
MYYEGQLADRRCVSHGGRRAGDEPGGVPPDLGAAPHEVYAFLRDGGAVQDGQNVMLYRDDVPNVEVGVQVAGSFTPAGWVIPSFLPAGQVATTVHRRPYAGLGAAHQAVLARCAARAHRVQGTRWESTATGERIRRTRDAS